MKNFNIFIYFIYKGVLPKKGGLTQFVDLRGAWQERRGGVFERGLIPQCTLCYLQARGNIHIKYQNFAIFSFQITRNNYHYDI